MSHEGIFRRYFSGWEGAGSSNKMRVPLSSIDGVADPSWANNFLCSLKCPTLSARNPIQCKWDRNSSGNCGQGYVLAKQIPSHPFLIRQRMFIPLLCRFLSSIWLLLRNQDKLSDPAGITSLNTDPVEISHTPLQISWYITSIPWDILRIFSKPQLWSFLPKPLPTGKWKDNTRTILVQMIGPLLSFPG